MSFDYLELSIQSCPACGGNDFSGLNKNDRYSMGLRTVGCNSCGLIQTNPRPSEAGLSLFYEKDYRRFYQGAIHPDQEYIKRHSKDVRLKYTVSFLRNLVDFGSDAAILDIGCSEGTLFSALRSNGYSGELYGVEVNREFAHYAEINNNAKVYSTLNMLKKPCDLVVVNHVLEHLLEPKKFLFDVSRLINDNGILYIDVPDTDEYKSINELHVAHIFHYTARTLSYLIELCGFNVVSCEKHNPPFHPKSIRLVAKKGSANLSDLRASTVIGEMSTWSRVQKIPYFMRRMRNIIFSLPFARKLCTALKRSK